MKKTTWIAGAALAATLGVAAYAAAPDGPPNTRAEVQARVAEQFKKADTNGDGFVTKAEADAARAAMKAKFAERRAERRDERFAALDTDKNGALSKEEFSVRQRPGGGDGEHRGHGRHGMHRGGMGGGHFGMGGMWFDRADANKDGKVSLAEASAGALAMFDRVDTNKDGTISPEEHKAARDAMRAKWQERRAGKEG
ncbi:hypothetical protein ASE00_19880 [Sphingomonas sp. Root710]|uniref:EF-hand domain-containing protein n=1 Tax=Sphingomonas sp. Root710 TaxID=1736594 RepID=UPI0006F3CE00|nr:EF-hand domain-containing protein [Sphingomonas sp. Root710]KRB79492.1 hypothetical protein ASE00_19880 [Sphingomonas sp. Root710]